MTKLTKKFMMYARVKGVGAESIRYIVAGVLTTLVNYGLFELLNSIIGIDVTISNVTSISVSILFAYVVNKLIVFRWHSNSLSALALEFLKFIGSRLFTMALEIGIVLLFHNFLGYSARLCKAAALVLVIISNYFLSKLLVFSSSDKTDRKENEN